MFFSQDKKNEDEKKKSRSLLGLMFNPRFGDDIKPMGEMIGMFVRIIAYVFASNGLFPKDHPALLGAPMNDSAARLTMAEVIRTAYGRLEFTRYGLPKVLIFVAVVGCLFFSAVLLILTLLSLFMGTAYAQNNMQGSMFTPANPDQDWGLGWINYIFLGIPINFLNGMFVAGSSGTCGWQSGMSQALGFYSGGILVLAGIILLYHLMKMVAETAHTGKPMGKADQIWAPIRLVVAIGLLVPIGAATSNSGGCSISGYNTGQYIVIQMTKWGSGLASNVWKTFVEKVNSERPPDPTACPTSLTSTNTSAGPASPSCNKPSQTAKLFAVGMLKNYMCALFYNHYMEQLNLREGNLVTEYMQNQNTVLLGNGTNSKICGGYSYYDANSLINNPYKPVYESQRTAVEMFLAVLKGWAADNAEYFWSGGKKTPAPDPGVVYNYLDTFQTNLNLMAKSSLEMVDREIANKMSENNKTFSSGGWLSAGVWFNTIAAFEAARSSAIMNGIPTIIPNLIEEENSYVEKSNQNPYKYSTSADVMAQIDTKGENAIVFTATNMKNFEKWLNEWRMETYFPIMPEQPFNAPTGAGFGTWVFDGVLSVVNSIAGWTNVWNSRGELAIKFDKSRNPLAEIAAFGQNVVGTGTNLIGWGAVLHTGGAALKFIATYIPSPIWQGVGTAISSAASIIGLFCISIGVFLLTFGILVAYFLPLVPFVRFFFASMTWMIGVAEAVIAAPLLALAHVNPEGDGLPGAQARQGYFLVVNMFLRPVLMIFGLIAGVLLFNVGVTFLNGMFSFAAYGTGAVNVTQAPVLSRVVFTVVYCSLVYVLANNCFRSIGMFPEYALRWLGSQGHLEKIGDHHAIVNAVAAAGAYVAGPKLAELAKKPGEMIGNIANRKKENTERENQELAAASRHAQLLQAMGRDDQGRAIPGGSATQHIPSIDVNANPDYGKQIDPQPTNDAKHDGDPKSLERLYLERL